MIRGQPRGGPPQEKTLAFSNVSAPRLARRPNPNAESSGETKDEVYIEHIKYMTIPIASEMQLIVKS